jgi:hypothetical protein
MKTIQMLATAGIVVSMLASCTKQSNESLLMKSNDASSLTVKGNAIATTTAPENVTSATGQNSPKTNMINLQLVTVPGNPSAGLIWDAGYISVGSLNVEAFEHRGNAFFRDYIESPVGQAVKLFSPAPLGTLNLPNGWFYNFNFGIMLSPTNASGSSLSLNGTYKVSNNKPGTPVQLIINEPLKLMAPLQVSPDLVLSGNSVHQATVFFNLNQLTAGITDAMLSEAQLTNGGVLVISQNSNANLYQRVLANIPSNMRVALK